MRAVIVLLAVLALPALGAEKKLTLLLTGDNGAKC